MREREKKKIINWFLKRNPVYFSGGMQGLQNMMRQFQQGAGGKMGNMFNFTDR